MDLEEEEKQELAQLRGEASASQPSAEAGSASASAL